MLGYYLRGLWILLLDVLMTDQELDQQVSLDALKGQILPMPVLG